MAHNRALDLILAATLQFRAGNHAEAAEHLQLAMDEPDLDEAIDMMDATGEDGLAEDSDNQVDACKAAFVKVGRRLSTTAGEDGALPASSEMPADNDAAAGTIKEGDTVSARLERSSHNRRLLSKPRR